MTLADEGAQEEDPSVVRAEVRAARLGPPYVVCSTQLGASTRLRGHALHVWFSTDKRESLCAGIGGNSRTTCLPGRARVVRGWVPQMVRTALGRALSSKSLTFSSGDFNRFISSGHEDRAS